MFQLDLIEWELSYVMHSPPTHGLHTLTPTLEIKAL